MPTSVWLRAKPETLVPTEPDLFWLPLQAAQTSQDVGRHTPFYLLLRAAETLQHNVGHTSVWSTSHRSSGLYCAPAGSYAGPAPVVEYAASFVTPTHRHGIHRTSAHMDEYFALAASYVTPAPVDKYIASTTAVAHVAPAHVNEYVTLVALCVTSAPVDEYIALTPAVAYVTTAPVNEYITLVSVVSGVAPTPVVKHIASGPAMFYGPVASTLRRRPSGALHLGAQRQHGSWITSRLQGPLYPHLSLGVHSACASWVRSASTCRGEHRRRPQCRAQLRRVDEYMAPVPAVQAAPASVGSISRQRNLGALHLRRSRSALRLRRRRPQCSRHQHLSTETSLQLPQCFTLHLHLHACH